MTISSAAKAVDQSMISDGGVGGSGPGTTQKSSSSLGGTTTEKKCSQNPKINQQIVPGILKNINTNNRLRVIHFTHYRFS